MPAKTYLFTASMILLLVACEKEKSFSTARPGSTGNSRLTIAISRWHDSAAYSFFYYDDQNKLKSIVDSENTNFSKRFTSFVYDADGKLLKRILTNDYNAMVIEDSFLYNNDLMIKRTTSSAWFAPYSHAFAYDGQGRLTGDTSFNSWNVEAASFVTYNYDNEGDIVKWREYHNFGGVMTSDGAVSASYNNSINPYFDLGLSVYTSWYDNRVLSKHLRTQLTFDDGTIEKFDNEYYPDGHVKKITTTDSSDGFSDSTTEEFFYE